AEVSRCNAELLHRVQGYLLTDAGSERIHVLGAIQQDVRAGRTLAIDAHARAAQTGGVRTRTVADVSCRRDEVIRIARQAGQLGNRGDADHAGEIGALSLNLRSAA